MKERRKIVTEIVCLKKYKRNYLTVKKRIRQGCVFQKQASFFKISMLSNKLIKYMKKILILSKTSCYLWKMQGLLLVYNNNIPTHDNMLGFQHSYWLIRFTNIFV